MAGRSLRRVGQTAAAATFAWVAIFATGPTAHADPYDGSRTFDISVSGAHYKGAISWAFTSTEPPKTTARVYNAVVSDTAADDYRAVAYVHWEYVPYEGSCDPVLGCSWTEGTWVKGDVQITSATPNGVSASANWGPNTVQGHWENIWVKVCTEQWRYDPNRIIACTSWK